MKQAAVSAGALAAVTFLVLFAACRSTPTPQSPAKRLAGTHWRLAALDGHPVDGPEVPTLVFGPETVQGDGGCNRYSGSATLYGHALQVGAIASTRRACEPGIMEREQRYLHLLGAARRVELEGTFLAIHCRGTVEPLRFAPYVPY